MNPNSPNLTAELTKCIVIKRRGIAPKYGDVLYIPPLDDVKLTTLDDKDMFYGDLPPLEDFYIINKEIMDKTEEVY